MNAGRIRLAIVGGGPGSLIGGVHRAAATMHDRFELVAGVFSSDPARSLQFSQRLGLDPARAHADIDAMIGAQQALPPDSRVEAVAVLTPNHLHHAMCRTLVEADLHVICEKPLTITSAQALDLARLVRRHARVFCVTHTYTGYPMVRQMRAMVADGAIGEVRKVDVQYYQGWVNPYLRDAAQRAGVWRLDPARGGQSCCVGDIGVHAFNLAEYVTQSRITRILAELDSAGADNALDVDGTALFRTDEGVRGIIRMSQVATGEENNLQIAVYGSRGALKWEQEKPMFLHHLREGQPLQVFTPGNACNEPAARQGSQLPPGHPQGLVEAMSNIYSGVANAIRGQPCPEGSYPGIDDGVRGMRFIEAALASSRQAQQWVEL